MRRAVLLMLPVLAGAALAACGPAGRAPAAEPEVTHVDRVLGYRCEFPSGAQPVDVRVGADVPVSGSVGLPVAPRAAAVTLSVGQPALADLTGMGAAAVGAVVRMDLTVTQGETAATTPWSG